MRNNGNNNVCLSGGSAFESNNQYDGRKYAHVSISVCTYLELLINLRFYLFYVFYIVNRLICMEIC